MTYNGKQLAALVNLGVAMAVADSNFAEVEKAAIGLELVKFGVPSNEVACILAAAKTMDASEAVITLSVMNDEQKKYATGYLASIMVSDGDIDDSEVKLWKLISTLGQFPTMTLKEALDFWRNN